MQFRWTYGLIIATLAGCGDDAINNGGGDTGVVEDADDATTLDTGDQDTGTPDVTQPDTGRVDTGTTDTGTAVDGGKTDAGTTDTGAVDGGTADTGAIDAGGADVVTTDVVTTDVVTTDAVTTDAVTTDVPGDVAADAPRPVICGAPVATIAMPSATAYANDATTLSTPARTSAIASTGCQTNATGPEDVYTLTVTARTLVRISTEATRTTFDTILSLRRTCNDVASEVACDDDFGRGTTSHLRAPLDPGTYSLLVDGYNGGVGPYNLAVSSGAPAANGLCTAPSALAPGGMVAAQNTAGAWVTSRNCSDIAEGPQLFYSITVPAMSAVTVRATPTGTPAWTPVVRVRAACADTTCAAASSGEMAGMPSSATITNGTAAARSYVVSVSSTTSADGAFDLSATAPTAVVRGATCDGAIALDPATPATGVNAMSGTISGSARCQSAVTGGQTFFAVRIPAGTRATVRATPTGTPAWAPTVRAFDTCASTSCVDSRAGTSGTATALAIDNGGVTPRDVIVTVAGAAPASSGTFDATVTLTPISNYTYSMIAGACDALTAAPAIAPAGGWDDDETTAITALPFPFTFSGAAATHYSVNSNGLMQLWPSMTGTPSTAYSNTTLPSAGTPNNLIAAFWDDLGPSDAATSNIRATTLGTAPNRRFVVQWVDWGFASDDTVRLNFQAKLFETTNVIELHYCSMTPAASTRVTGDSATVGVEDAAGAMGTQVSYNRAGAVAPANAFRLTPR